jgi:hypothetical protein
MLNDTSLFAVKFPKFLTIPEALRRGGPDEDGDRLGDPVILISAVSGPSPFIDTGSFHYKKMVRRIFN